jgi:hypothetical protein
MSPPITVPAVVLSPGLLLAALSGVTQPVAKNKVDTTRVGKIVNFLILKSFIGTVEIESLTINQIETDTQFNSCYGGGAQPIALSYFARPQKLKLRASLGFPNDSHPAHQIFVRPDDRE